MHIDKIRVINDQPSRLAGKDKVYRRYPNGQSKDKALFVVLTLHVFSQIPL
jgi:hypothetical protein